MNILLTNDDGIDAKGIRAIADGLKDDYNIFIAAPNMQRSANSHSVTYFFHDILVEENEIPGVKKAWSIHGTPADCVCVAHYALMDEPIDLVISGVNHGWNVSMDCFYSGTVGAAREAMFEGIPGMAISIDNFQPDDFSLVVSVLKKTIPLFLKDVRKHEYVLNINVPDVKEEDCKGILVTNFHTPWLHRYDNKLVAHRKDDTHLVVQSVHNQLRNDFDEFIDHMDASALKNGYVTLTPLSTSIVDEAHIEVLKTWDLKK